MISENYNIYQVKQCKKENERKKELERKSICQKEIVNLKRIT